MSMPPGGMMGGMPPHMSMAHHPSPHAMVQGQSPIGVPQGHPGGPQGHPQGGPGHPGPPQGHDQARMDNISKAKALLPLLKDSLSKVLIYAATALNANNCIDSSTMKGSELDFDVSRFDKALEEFFSLCDGLEVHLKTSLECINQGMCSQRYLSTQVTPTKMEGGLTYHQYINVVKGQVAFAKEIHDTLLDAAQKISTD